MPAPLANKNRMRHGLTAGRLPAGCAFIAKQVNHFRRVLEQAVIDAHGEIDLTLGASINTAARWERHAQLCQRWLAVCPDLTHENRLAFSRDAARASTERDKAIAALGLKSVATRDQWSGVFDHVPAVNGIAVAAAQHAHEPPERDATPNVDKRPCPATEALDAAVANAAWGNE